MEKKSSASVTASEAPVKLFLTSQGRWRNNNDLLRAYCRLPLQERDPHLLIVGANYRPKEEAFFWFGVDMLRRH